MRIVSEKDKSQKQKYGDESTENTPFEALPSVGYTIHGDYPPILVPAC